MWLQRTVRSSFSRTAPTVRTPAARRSWATSSSTDIWCGARPGVELPEPTPRQTQQTSDVARFLVWTRSKPTRRQHAAHQPVQLQCPRVTPVRHLRLGQRRHATRCLFQNRISKNTADFCTPCPRRLPQEIQLSIVKAITVIGSYISYRKRREHGVRKSTKGAAVLHWLVPTVPKQEAQLMLTTGSTRLLAVSRARAISDGTLT